MINFSSAIVNYPFLLKRQLRQCMAMRLFVREKFFNCFSFLAHFFAKKSFLLFFKQILISEGELYVFFVHKFFNI